MHIIEEMESTFLGIVRGVTNTVTGAPVNPRSKGIYSAGKTEKTTLMDMVTTEAYHDGRTSIEHLLAANKTIS